MSVNAPVGRTAAQLLLEKTLGTDAHRHRQVTFKPELEIRQSSGGTRPGA